MATLSSWASISVAELSTTKRGLPLLKSARLLILLGKFMYTFKGRSKDGLFCTGFNRSFLLNFVYCIGISSGFETISIPKGAVGYCWSKILICTLLLIEKLFVAFIDSVLSNELTSTFSSPATLFFFFRFCRT